MNDHASAGGHDVVIVASGGANIASLQFALERLGCAAEISSDPRRIEAASHVLLPGVGAAAHAMNRLRDYGLDRLIPQLEQPVLGICLGMQLLFEASDEGPARCLGIVPGTAARFSDDAEFPVPHMGWNTLEVNGTSALTAGLGNRDYVYFVHSFALPVTAATVAVAHYGIPFSACVAWRNFFGVQFHPERSAAAGARVLKNFLALGKTQTGCTACA